MSPNEFSRAPLTKAGITRLGTSARTPFFAGILAAGLAACAAAHDASADTKNPDGAKQPEGISATPTAAAPIPLEAEPARATFDLSRGIAVQTRAGVELPAAVLAGGSTGFSTRLPGFSFAGSEVSTLTDRLVVRVAVPFSVPAGMYPEFLSAGVSLKAEKGADASLVGSIAVSAFALDTGTATEALPNGASLGWTAFDLTRRFDLTGDVPEAKALREAFCGAANPAGVLTITLALGAERANSGVAYRVLADNADAANNEADLQLGSGALHTCP